MRLTRRPRLNGPHLLGPARVAAIVAGALVAGFGSSVAGSRTPPEPAAAATPPKTVWLCRPTLTDNPCTQSLTATVVDSKGNLRVEHSRPAKRPPVDCFYVYPTVSAQTTTNANLHVDPEERAVAILQASRFSQVCRVFAPMYPQLTRHAILQPGGITTAGALTAYNGVRAGFAAYLDHDNHGRGIVFIGHSQGASLLVGLLKHEVDSKPAVRHRLVSALILGGNVTVPAGKQAGGDFNHIPACRSVHQTGCVVAYSSFAEQPSATAKFGRVTGGLNPFTPKTPDSGRHIMCVNPASPGGGKGALLTYFPVRGAAAPRLHAAGQPSVSTPWVAYPHEYTARCKSGDRATWLQVDRSGGAADQRPAVSEPQGPDWGLHVYDVNLALGNLVGLVRDEAQAYGPSRSL